MKRPPIDLIRRRAMTAWGGDVVVDLCDYAERLEGQVSALEAGLDEAIAKDLEAWDESELRRVLGDDRFEESVTRARAVVVAALAAHKRDSEGAQEGASHAATDQGAPAPGSEDTGPAEGPGGS